VPIFLFLGEANGNNGDRIILWVVCHFDEDRAEKGISEKANCGGGRNDTPRETGNVHHQSEMTTCQCSRSQTSGPC